MAAGYLIQANAWGGAWGCSWWGAWGNAWGQWTAEIDDVQFYVGGGGKAGRTGRHEELSVDVVRQQWELLELRLRQDLEQSPKQETIVVQEDDGQEEPEGAGQEVMLSMPAAEPIQAEKSAGEKIIAQTVEDDSEAKVQAQRRRNQAALLLILSQA